MFKYLFSFYLLVSVLDGISGQVSVKLSPEIEMTFPNTPESFDTLGQKVFNYSDENGYYACIIHHNALPSGKTPMDLKSYYANVYKSLQQQHEQCKLISQTELVIAGIKAAEFYSTCKEDPDFPEIRYIRFFLYGHDLYVLDYWTTKAHLAQAETNKSKFLNSFILHQGANDAVIPTAIVASNHTDTDLGKYILGITLAGLAILGFLYFRFFLNKRVKDSNPGKSPNKSLASSNPSGKKSKK